MTTNTDEDDFTLLMYDEIRAVKKWHHGDDDSIIRDAFLKFYKLGFFATNRKEIIDGWDRNAK